MAIALTGSETPDTWLLDPGNAAIPPSANESNQTDHNTPGRFFNELVDIFVNKGKFNRQVTERFMAQQIAVLRPEFANVAKHVAICFATSSPESEGASVVQFEVMQALQDCEHEDSFEPSLYLMSSFFVFFFACFFVFWFLLTILFLWFCASVHYSELVVMHTACMCAWARVEFGL